MMKRIGFTGYCCALAGAAAHSSDEIRVTRYG